MYLNIARTLFAFVFAGMVSVCIAKTPIDQIPEYGGMDRGSIPKLAAGDKLFIEGVTKKYGSRKKASQAFSERGRYLYQINKLEEAMKRLNQSWLLDRNNYEAYWGFGVVMLDRKHYAESLKWLKKAFSLNSTNPEVNADLAYMYSVLGRSTNSTKQKKNNFAKSNKLFSRFKKTNGKPPYLYYTWARSLAMQNRAKESYSKLKKYRKLGGAIDTADLDAWLKQKLR